MVRVGFAAEAECMDAPMVAWRIASAVVNSRVSDNSISHDSSVYLLTTHIHIHKCICIYIHMYMWT